jgi:hypothetical protein
MRLVPGRKRSAVIVSADRDPGSEALEESFKSDRLTHRAIII